MLWTGFGRVVDPWREFGRMEAAMDRMFSGRTAAGASEFPAVNVWANGERTYVTSEIPGIDTGKVDISVAGKTLTIHGGRDPVEVGEGGVLHRRERWYGKFSRIVELPYPVDAEKVEATFSRGVLTITLPRAEGDKPRKISVKAE